MKGSVVKRVVAKWVARGCAQPVTVTKAGSTHPTGMHFSFKGRMEPIL